MSPEDVSELIHVYGELFGVQFVTLLPARVFSPRAKSHGGLKKGQPHVALCRSKLGVWLLQFWAPFYNER